MACLGSVRKTLSPDKKEGFDQYFGLISGQAAYYELWIKKKRKAGFMAYNGGVMESAHEGFYMTDAFTDRPHRLFPNHDNKKSGSTFSYIFKPTTPPQLAVHALPENV